MSTATIGIDLGSKRIGAAICEAKGLPAVPLGVIPHTSWAADIEAIVKLADARGAANIVVGVPLRMDGTQGQEAQRAVAFIHALRERFRGSVLAQDERFTTAVADRKLRALPVSGSKRRQHRDKLAAVEILNAYLAADQNGSCAT